MSDPGHPDRHGNGSKQGSAHERGGRHGSGSGAHDRTGRPADRPARGVPPRLPEELRSLGRSLDATGPDLPDSMVERVLGQILAEHLAVPVAEPPGPPARLRAARRWTRTRWRSLTATLCGLLTVLALTPPVRAAVLDWFEFGGVEVRYDPAATPPPSAEVPGCGPSMSLAEAERRAGVRPLVPDALGEPDGVTVTPAPDRRSLLTLCWTEPGGGTIRLEQDLGLLDMGFVKTVSEELEWISLRPTGGDLNTASALWFPRPHDLDYWLLTIDGDRFARETRVAGPTLLWTHDAGTRYITLRLEGVEAKDRAVRIAQSLPESD